MVKGWTKILGLLCVITLVSLADARVQSNVQDAAQKMVNLHRNWGERMSTPGASVVAVEDKTKQRMKRQKAEDGSTQVPFLIQTTGLPKEKIYLLAVVAFPNMQPQVQMMGIGLNAAGIAVCPGTADTCSSEAGPDDPVDLIVPAARGQVFHFALVSADGQSRAMFTLTPYPIRATDKSCKLELQRLLPRAELVYLVVTGLTPNSDLELTSNSADEKHTGKGKADAAGHYESALLPAVQGKTHGKLDVKIASPGCSPEASIDWGEGSERPQ